MKTTLLKISFIFLFLSLMGVGCEKEIHTCACGVDNPQDKLVWLKQIINSKSNDVKVYSFLSDKSEYIVVESVLGNALTQFYNCNGELKCEFGGTTGATGNCNMPDEYWSDYERNKKLIYP